MRKTQPKKIPLAPDPKFNDKLVTRFVNNLMWAGKKSGAYIIFYDALDKVAKITGENGYEVWKKALGNITPGVEVRSRRIGGATYQVPREVKEKRAMSLAFRWILGAARAKKGQPMAIKLANELMQAAKGEGEAIKKKINVHKMADANKAFAYLAR